MITNRGNDGVSRLFEFSQGQLSILKRLIVIGDLHGDMRPLESILKIFDPRSDAVVFLGDYADRGAEGIEVIEAVDRLVRRYPNNVVTLKGNHEDYSLSGEPLFSPCNLVYEAETKKGGWRRYFEQEFSPFKDRLYLAAILPGRYLFVHGGISSRIAKLDDLRKPTVRIEADILWSDPITGYGEQPNPRGAGVCFGEDITAEVCDRLDVSRIIRSHEPQKAARGPFYEHGGRIVTVNATSVYGGRPFALMINMERPSDLSHIFL